VSFVVNLLKEIVNDESDRKDRNVQEPQNPDGIIQVDVRRGEVLVPDPFHEQFIVPVPRKPGQREGDKADKDD
jgi:hypothetical protein